MAHQDLLEDGFTSALMVLIFLLALVEPSKLL
jgi:hypothetical protein